MGLPTWAACLRSETALHGVASVLPCATVSRTCHGGRMAPSLLVCYTLAKTVVLFTGRVQGRCTRANPLVSQLLDP